ncbi:MAG: hypothetical protein PHE61_00785 [Candidatus Omnitrophica bacterium]|nr:hypothetical protein [Candidatus Omnitrophota bacterium]
MKPCSVFLFRIGEDKLQIAKTLYSYPDRIVIKSFHECETTGFRGGVVSDLEAAGEEVEDLFRRAEMSLEHFEPPLYVVVDELPLRTYVHQSAISISRSGRTIGHLDTRRVVELTRKTAMIPLDQTIIFTVPEEYRVDDMGEILNPFGLEGRRLGAKLFLYTLEHTAFQNLRKVFYRSGLESIELLPASWMVAQGILRESEMRGKTLLIDLEGNHTAISLVNRFAPIMFNLIPQGSDRILQQLADDYDLSLGEAKRLGERFGTLELQSGFDAGKVPLPTRRGEAVKTVELEHFQKKIHESSVQLLKTLKSEIDKILAIHPDVASFVVTGQVFAMHGFLELAQSEWSLQAPVRFGLATGVEGDKDIVTHPARTALMGAARWIASEKTRHIAELEERGLFHRQFERVKIWIQRYL